MQQPLYLLLAWAAENTGLAWLVEQYQPLIVQGLAVLALFSCLLGFYCYRAVASGLTFLGVTLAGFLWVLPLWGKQSAVTFSTVLGVAGAFMMFRCSRLGGVLLCALIGGSWAWQLTGQSQEPAILTLVIIGAAALAAGLLTFLFPLWSICGFTAVWGAVVFAQEGWHLWSGLPQGGEEALLLMAGLSLAGMALQSVLFRRQKLFTKIMPRRLEHRLEQRKRKRREAA